MAADIVENEETGTEEPQLPDDKVDPPRELLSDALRKDYSDPIMARGLRPSLCLEIGGSKRSLLSAAALSSQPLCILSRHTSPQSEEGCLMVQSDRIQCFLPRLLNKVDILLLSPEQNHQNNLILPFISRLLAPKGRYYLLLSEEHKPVELCRQMGKKGLASREVMSKQCGRTTFSVFCFTHKK